MNYQISLGEKMTSQCRNNNWLQPQLVHTQIWSNTTALFSAIRCSRKPHRTADTCSYCPPEVKVMLNLSASMVKYVHKLLQRRLQQWESVNGNLLWAAWTQRSRHLISPLEAFEHWETVKKRQNSWSLSHAKTHVTWGFGALNHQTVFQSRVSF